MNKFLLLFLGVIFSVGLSAQTDLFFSEYVEGSGNNKALEIYNPTSQTIDLTKYYVVRFSNGSQSYDTGGITQLKGTIAPYKTFVLVNGQSTSTETSPAPDPLLQAKADQLDGAYPAPTYMNGNDAMALLKTETGDVNDALPVDLFGKIGQGSKIKSETGWAPFTDTTITYLISGVEYHHTISEYIIKAKDDTNAASGPYWLAWSANHTLRRKFNIIDGVKANPDAFNVSMEWDTISVAAEGVDKETGETYTYRSYEDIWDDLGKHKCVADPNSGNAVNTFENTSINLFPTLVSDQIFTIQSSTNLIQSVAVYNLKGEQVFLHSCKPSSKVEIHLPNLSRGLYMVKTITDNQSQRMLRIAIQ